MCVTDQWALWPKMMTWGSCVLLSTALPLQGTWHMYSYEQMQNWRWSEPTSVWMHVEQSLPVSKQCVQLLKTEARVKGGSRIAWKGVPHQFQHSPHSQQIQFTDLIMKHNVKCIQLTGVYHTQPGSKKPYMYHQQWEPSQYTQREAQVSPGKHTARINQSHQVCCEYQRGL